MSHTTNKVSAANISLGEFVTSLILRMDEKNTPMPFQNEEKWHRLFYKLKRDRSATGRPIFFDQLRFDWDGRFPKSQDLSEYLQVMHWNGFVSVMNPTYDRLKVDENVKQHASDISPKIEDRQLDEFIAQIVKEAKSSFAAGLPEMQPT
jgi:hypothetical protein